MLLGPEPMAGEPSRAGCSQLGGQGSAGEGWCGAQGSPSPISYCSKVGRWDKPRRRPGGSAVFGEGKQESKQALKCISSTYAMFERLYCSHMMLIKAHHGRPSVVRTEASWLLSPQRTPLPG